MSLEEMINHNTTAIRALIQALPNREQLDALCTIARVLQAQIPVALVLDPLKSPALVLDASESPAPESPAPAPAPAPAQALAAAPPVAPGEDDVAQCTKLVLEHSRQKGRDAAIELLASFGVKRASELPAAARGRYIEAVLAALK